jgi:hypothetical protein
MKKITVVISVTLGLVALMSFIILPKFNGGTDLKVAFDVPNTKNEITMPVISVDESENTYATIWLTPSQRIYTLAKDVPNYKKYIEMMENSRANHIPLAFTLAEGANEDSLTAIIKITKASQEAVDYYNDIFSNLEPVAEEVAPPMQL